MIRIREATEADNHALIELQTQCPQGTSFVLGVDSSPDFFARSRPFKDWHVFVATKDDSIIGSAACAFNDTQVGGRRLRTALEYGFIVDPKHRRKGIAANLQKKIEQTALKRNVDLLHLDIMKDNLPSMNLFWKMGFRRARDFSIPSAICEVKSDRFPKPLYQLLSSHLLPCRFGHGADYRPPLLRADSAM